MSGGLVGNNNSNSVVVVCSADRVPSRANFSGASETALSVLMEFHPLRLAFGEYCRKALCSEVCATSKSLGWCAVSWAGPDRGFSSSFRDLFVLPYLELSLRKAGVLADTVCY